MLRLYGTGQCFYAFLVAVGAHMHLEHTGLLATEEGQYPVRRRFAYGFLPVEPALELAHLLVLLVHSARQARGQHGLAPEDVAHTVAALHVFAHPLGYDVARALQRLVVP